MFTATYTINYILYNMTVSIGEKDTLNVLEKGINIAIAFKCQQVYMYIFSID